MLSFLKFLILKGQNLLKKANSLWSFFSSVKLTLVLLLLMVVLFIVATLIPQQNVSPGFAWLADIYHSKVFYVLIGLFSLNLIICSMNRLPLTIKQYKASSFPVPSGLLENLPPDRTIITDKKMEDVSRAVESSLASKSISAKRTDAEQDRLYFFEWGRFSLFGVYIVHLGVLIIIAGALIGLIFGFEAGVNLAERDESSIVELAKGKGTQELDFSVRCDKFSLELYETGAPKTYKSDLSFIKNGQVVHQGSVLVNHPVTFEGLRFYQSSYGVSENTKALLRYRNAGGESKETLVAQGSTFDLPAQKAKATVLRVEENMMQFGPAVKLSIETEKGNVQFWIFQHIKEIAEVNPGLFSAVPLFNPALFKPLVFSLQRIERQYYTGLLVVRDPGVSFVLAGGLMLVAGMMIIFFFSHRRVWILAQQEQETIKISVAGRSNRYNEALQGQIDDLCKRIAREIAA